MRNSYREGVLVLFELEEAKAARARQATRALPLVVPDDLDLPEPRRTRLGRRRRRRSLRDLAQAILIDRGRQASHREAHV